eukprot:scaffold73210_cov53-Phaeocystis_antarctica.AAC.3
MLSLALADAQRLPKRGRRGLVMNGMHAANGFAPRAKMTPKPYRDPPNDPRQQTITLHAKKRKLTVSPQRSASPPPPPSPATASPPPPPSPATASPPPPPSPATASPPPPPSPATASPPSPPATRPSGKKRCVTNPQCPERHRKWHQPTLRGRGTRRVLAQVAR